MQLRKIALMVAALGVVLTGCPGPDENEMCTTNADCLESELCHPTAGVCVQTCNLAADCPDTAKNCEALGGTSADAATKVCKCTSGANQCNLGRAEDDRVCSPQGVCVQKCTEDANCGTGETCEVATGICKSTTTTCDPAASQPGTCGYGNICGTTNNVNSCQPAPEGTCSEATAAGAPAWSKTGGTAPVIVSATAQRLATTNSSNECAGGEPAGLVTIRFYAPGGLTTHTTFTDLQNHVRFRPGTGNFFGANFSRQMPMANAVEGTMQVGIGCGNSTETVAIYIANEAGQTSNVVCVNW
jgi:hypothetical protein